MGPPSGATTKKASPLIIKSVPIFVVLGLPAVCTVSIVATLDPVPPALHSSRRARAGQSVQSPEKSFG